MLMIRLSRTGKKNFAFYNLVVTEKTNPASDGNFLEKLGTYSPTRDGFSFEKERIEHWIKHGAQVSETVARLLDKQGMAGMDRFVDLKRKFTKKSDKVAEQPAAEAPAAEAPAA